MSSDGPVAGGIDDHTPVQITPGQTQYQHFRRGNVAGEGHIVLVSLREIEPRDILRANRMMYAESLLALVLGLAVRLMLVL